MGVSLSLPPTCQTISLVGTATSLDLAVAHGLRRVPPLNDPGREALRDRGFEHEQHYLASLEAQGLRVANFSHLRGDASAEVLLSRYARGQLMSSPKELSGKASGQGAPTCSSAYQRRASSARGRTK